jgi:NADH-quinone oxidoreductase subunit E
MVDSKKHLQTLISAEGMNEIDNWIAKYPQDQRQSAVMAALRIVQEEKGFLTPEYMDAVADYLNMPAIAVYEVSTFYTMYEHKPTATNIINVCTNISCKLRDSDSIVNHLKQKLGIKLGETTQDGRFSLRSVECLGACVNAPMLQLNKDYHENLTPEKVDALLAQYTD